MNILARLRFNFSGLRGTKSLGMKTCSLSLTVLLLLNASGCGNLWNSQTPINSHRVELIASLVGVTAQMGVFHLTQDHMPAVLIEEVARPGAKYLLEEYAIQCKACGAISTFRDQVTREGEPSKVGCSNVACYLHEFAHAFLVVFSSQDRMTSNLPQVEDKLPPTCLFTVNETKIKAGNRVELTWHSQNATYASLNGVAVDTEGSRWETPKATTTYLLSVIGRYGKDEHRTTVQVAESQRTRFLPAGLMIEGKLEKELRTGDTNPGEEFHIQVDNPVFIGHINAVPVGSRIIGTVVESRGSGRVRGKARLSLAFKKLRIGSRVYRIAAERLTWEARSSARRDIGEIAGGAGIGALVGGLTGGRRGARIGAAVGAGAGTGVVLATRGKEVKLQRGQKIQVKLVEPVRIQVKQ